MVCFSLPWDKALPSFHAVDRHWPVTVLLLGRSFYFWVGGFLILICQADAAYEGGGLGSFSGLESLVLLWTLAVVLLIRFLLLSSLPSNALNILVQTVLPSSFWFGTWIRLTIVFWTGSNILVLLRWPLVCSIATSIVILLLSIGILDFRLIEWFL